MAEQFRNGFGNNYAYGSFNGNVLAGSGAIIILAILIFCVTGGTSNSVEYKIPEGGRPEEEYLYSDSIPSAPIVFPDENAPQISVSENSGKKLDATGVLPHTREEWIMCLMLPESDRG